MVKDLVRNFISMLLRADTHGMTKPSGTWRGKPMDDPKHQRWSEIEAMNRADLEIEKDQAVHGYWGGMEDSADEDSAEKP